MMPHQIALMAVEVVESAQRLMRLQTGELVIPAGHQMGMVPPRSLPLPPRQVPRCQYCGAKLRGDDSCQGCGAPT